MTRDETIALFLECEAKRKEAREAALAQGADEVDVLNAAHDAAKVHWNAWADSMLARRKALEESKPENAETRAWIEAAAVDFSSVHFQISPSNGLERPKLVDTQEITNRSVGTPLEEWRRKKYPVKQLVMEGSRRGAELQMTCYVFPGTANFAEARFEGYVSFMGATFLDCASFEGTIFKRGAGLCADFRDGAIFWDAVFSEEVSFYRSSFSGSPAQFRGTNFFNATTSFESAVFKARADFGTVTFGNFARFDDVSFMDDADFREVTFKGGTTFAHSTFEKRSLFRRATFEKSADFSGANFKDEALFSKASFSGDIRFHSTTFCKSTFFRDTRPCRQLRRVRQATPDQKLCAAFIAVVSLGIPKSLFL